MMQLVNVNSVLSASVEIVLTVNETLILVKSYVD